MMSRISIFGATGPTGLCLVRQAVTKGAHVKCLVRTPEKIPLELRESGHVELVVGDANDTTAVDETIRGSNAVIVTLGGGTICSEAQPTINQSILRNGSPRAIVITSLGVGDSYPKLGFFTKLFVDYVISAAIADKNKQEETVKSELENWVLLPVEVKYLSF
eukprot:TRINITY_DN11089_c0_g1_i5.p1 TRINITY_DN11089_c0_g1~~TRINITY_DN11089_c0_g1_i5.p1  ORF type:complete len:162 (-),score=26.51 TRINITY_DN11089_c0_g1_i5:207-692(-)